MSEDLQGNERPEEAGSRPNTGKPGAAGSSRAKPRSAGSSRAKPRSAEAGPSLKLIVGLVLFMVAFAAFLAWMLSIGGETDAQRNLRELDARASPAPQGDPPRLASEGKAIYDKHCIACHGSGAVGGSSGPALVAKRYTPPRWEDQDLANVIYGGRGSMPAFSDRMSIEELAAVVAYIRWEQGLPAPGAQVRESPA